MLTWLLSGAYLYAMYKITKGYLEDSQEQREFYKLQKQQEMDAKLQAAKESWRKRPWYEKAFVYSTFLIIVLFLGIAIFFPQILHGFADMTASWIYH